MAPRNNDATTSYKKNYPVEEQNDEKNILPSILHKKHRVVKLVKSQIQKIQEEGLICASDGNDEVELIHPTMRMRQLPEMTGEEMSGQEMSRQETKGKRSGIWWFSALILFLIACLIFLMVWISAGPLSNPLPRTPVIKGSFIQTEGLCSLEKKYLLRWGKPDYAE